MKSLEQIKNDTDVVNAIDWDMTPEEAVTLYLEWGNNWSHGNLVRSKDDVSHYFVVYTWEEPPRVILVKRNSETAEDLAEEELPLEFRDGLVRSVGKNKGLYAPNEEIKQWLKRKLDA